MPDRFALFLVVVSHLALVLPASTQAAVRPGELATRAQRDALASRRLDIAKCGHRDVVLDLRRVLRNLGASPEELARSDGQCKKALAKSRKKRALRPKQREQLEALVDALALRLPGLKGDARIDLAFEIVSLDASNEAANAALGRKRVDVEGASVWLDEEQRARRARVVEVQEAVRFAMDWDPEITIRKVSHEVHARMGYEESLELRYKTIKLISPVSRDRSLQVFRQALRAASMLEFLLSGKQQVHRVRDGYTHVLVDDYDKYCAEVERAGEAGGLEAKLVGHAKRWSSYHDKRGYTLQRFVSSPFAATCLLVDYSYSRGMAPFFQAGLCNWICEIVIGHKMPDMIANEREVRGGTGASIERRTDEIDPASYRDAGTYGRRKWMEWLVRTGTAPTILECFEPEIGKLRGKELLKCTLAIEFWMEEGPMLELMQDFARKKSKSGRDYVECFENASGLTIPEFETDWKAWLLGSEPSILERLAPERDKGETPGWSQAVEAAQMLSGLRVKFLSKDLYEGLYQIKSQLPRAAVQASRELTSGATVLAAQLVERKVGDLSDEARDELHGLRPRGAWAATCLIFDPTSTSAERSLQRLLGNFYHRAALLNPGLRAIGWATKDDVAVVDATSLVGEADGFWGFAWPVDKARRVPTRHAKLTPSPVPAQAASELGYPVSLHLGPDVQHGSAFRVELELRKGSATGALVDCWLSSPSRPTREAWAPRNVWCLIPKKPLAKSTQYHVSARVHSAEPRQLRWSFRTGS